MSAVLEEARATTNRVARTFAIACRLLPREVRDDVYLLYLVFRTLDDLVDDGFPDAEERVAAVADWAEGLPARSPEVAILEDLTRRHTLPLDAFADFCAGMRQDMGGTDFETEADVDRYCYRVAGTVGLVMAGVLGTSRFDRARPAAAALGMAMQRTNILRDIDEDFANGRVYIAREALARVGGALAPGERETLLRDQIPRADALYEQGFAGIGELKTGRRAIAAAGAMYRELLRELEREGYGIRPGRVVVGRRRKLRVAAKAAWRV
jgi:15-cis-phytoene synthase